MLILTPPPAPTVLVGDLTPLALSSVNVVELFAPSACINNIVLASFTNAAIAVASMLNALDVVCPSASVATTVKL